MKRTERSWRVRVPASTSNLGSGFDVLGLGLGMYLELEMHETGQGIEVSSQGDGAEKLPTDGSNLIAQMALRTCPELAERGFRIDAVSEIPLTRGYGSSASAIVGGLALGQLAARGELDHEELLAISTDIEGHPDNVSASIYGGLTVSGVVDGKVVSRALRLPESLRVVAVTPHRELSTAAARAALPDAYRREDVVFNLQRLGLLLAGLQAGDAELIAMGTEDRLHQDYRCDLFPVMREVIGVMRAHEGCAGAFVSGAGPAVVAFASADEAEAIGAAGKQAFNAVGVDADYRVVAVDYEGIALR